MSHWIGIPEDFAPANPQMRDVLRYLRRAGVPYRTERVLMQPGLYGDHLLHLIWIPADGVATAAIIINDVMYDHARFGGLPPHCEGCGAEIGQATTCPECGLQRVQDLSEDKLRTWVLENLPR